MIHNGLRSFAGRPKGRGARKSTEAMEGCVDNAALWIFTRESDACCGEFLEWISLCLLSALCVSVARSWRAKCHCRSHMFSQYDSLTRKTLCAGAEKTPPKSRPKSKFPDSSKPE